MEQKKKYQHNGGRKPKLDPRTHRYSFNLDDVENAKFHSLIGQATLSKRILLRIAFSVSHLRLRSGIKVRLIITFS